MKIFLTSFFVIISFLASAQIGGLSSSKLSALSADVVNDKNMEFEPGFRSSRSNKYFDSDGNTQDMFSTSDSVKHVTGMAFRFTYGLWDKFEIGMSVSTDLSLVNIGTKYEFINKENLSIAAIAGLNVPMGNGTVNESIRATTNVMQAGVGGVVSYILNDRISADFTAQYVHFIKSTIDNNTGGVYLNGDVGYYFFDNNFKLITGFGFYSINNDIGSHQALTVYPGFTVESGKDYFIACSFPFDVYGKNEAKNVAFNFTLTLTFD
ncbi:MAG: hypothetical protein B6I18_06495 [Bacteroidetes bacterium 4572_112]|nr:MAG: hypothetical protein B6I18_06495 [Bacteroidetes bacterium 4572_112]